MELTIVRTVSSFSETKPSRPSAQLRVGSTLTLHTDRAAIQLIGANQVARMYLARAFAVFAVAAVDAAAGDFSLSWFQFNSLQVASNWSLVKTVCFPCFVR